MMLVEVTKDMSDVVVAKDMSWVQAWRFPPLSEPLRDNFKEENTLKVR